MDFTLKHWTKPGKPERIYLNDYADGVTAYVEREGEGIAVHATGRSAPGKDRVLADIKARFRLQDVTWAALLRAASRPAPPARPAPAPGASAMDTALLSVTLAGRPMPSPVTVTVADSVPDKVVEMLARVRNLTVERSAPALCDIALPGRIAFVLGTMRDLAGAGGPLIERAEARDGIYACTHYLAEGDLGGLGDGLPSATLNIAALTARTRTMVVPVVSQAHAGFAVACLLREALTG